jgi:type II secretory pathway component GspD/PulD (secretin)
LAILLTHPTFPSLGAEATGPAAPLISLTAKDESLKAVLEKIAKHTGYQFYLSEEWKKTPISIELHNETLRASISRLLKGLNYAITWDESQKTISLFICHAGKCSGTMLDVSLSGQETKFVQPTSTIVE